MKRKRAVYIVLSILLSGVFFFNIEGSTIDLQDEPGKPVMTQRQMEKLKLKKQRKTKKLIDSLSKAHLKHQTKAVRKRMKKDLKKANDFNSKDFGG